MEEYILASGLLFGCPFNNLEREDNCPFKKYDKYNLSEKIIFFEKDIGSFVSGGKNTDYIKRSKIQKIISHHRNCLNKKEKLLA